MRKTFIAMCAVLALTVAGTATAQILQLIPGGTITLSGCTPDGATSTTLPKGYYELHVNGEDAYVCYAATCATGGMDRRRGNHGPTYIAVETPVSCRSAGGGADVQFVPGHPVRSL